MTKTMAGTLAICSAGVAYLAYLYLRIVENGYVVTISF